MSTRDPRSTRSQPKRRPWAVTCGDLSGELETMTNQGMLMKRTDETAGSRDAAQPRIPVRPLPYNQEMLMGANDA
jgi:hypothetical protein